MAVATTFTNGRVLTPAGLIDGGLRAVDGMLVAVGSDVTPAGGDVIVDLAGDTLVPGFIDVQVNGGGGVLLNDSPTVEAIAAIGKAHAQFGTTGFLPTLITDDLAVVKQAVAAVDAAIAAGVRGVLGIHIEGPFLNPARKGIHDASKMAVLDEDGFAAVTGLKAGRTLVTLAPEQTDAAMITRLVAAGLIVSAGHTAADHAQMTAAFEAGVTAVTHLFNAMPQMTSRAPGPIAAALESDAWCGLIVDGHHVDPVMLKLAWRAKADRRFVLVTDAMPSVGTQLDHFMLGDVRIEVRDGILRGPDGTLAGSHLDMAGAIANAQKMIGLSLEQAVTLASAEPAAMLGLSEVTGSIRPGLRADLVRLDSAGKAAGTWIGGNKVA
jgi:N-acetylglucosamine-6-phosphate deacetylase